MLFKKTINEIKQIFEHSNDLSPEEISSLAKEIGIDEIKDESKPAKKKVVFVSSDGKEAVMSDKHKENKENPNMGKVLAQKYKAGEVSAIEVLNYWIPLLNIDIQNFIIDRQFVKGQIQTAIDDYDNTQKIMIDERIKKGNGEKAISFFYNLKDHSYPDNTVRSATTEAVRTAAQHYILCRDYLKEYIGEFDIDVLYDLCKAQAEKLRATLKKNGAYMEGDNFFYDPTPDKEYDENIPFVYDPHRNYKRDLVNWEIYGDLRKELDTFFDENEYGTEYLQPFFTKRYFYHVIRCFERAADTFWTTRIDGNRCQDHSYKNKNNCFVDADGKLIEEDLTTLWPEYDFHGLI